MKYLLLFFVTTTMCLYSGSFRLLFGTKEEYVQSVNKTMQEMRDSMSKKELRELGFWFVILNLTYHLIAVWYTPTFVVMLLSMFLVWFTVYAFIRSMDEEFLNKPYVGSKFWRIPSVIRWTHLFYILYILALNWSK